VKFFFLRQRNCNELSSIKKTNFAEEHILNSTEAKKVAIKKNAGFLRHPYKRSGRSCFVRALESYSSN
jgi:hypothetical protein